MASSGSSIEQMTALKLQKLQEQKDISDKMSALLSDHLNPNAKETCKNLKAAIAGKPLILKVKWIGALDSSSSVLLSSHNNTIIAHDRYTDICLF
tara:strand:- start:277 stop:561 length:285 start_codon:yes stop_codon:yes gene_type:complete